jgi:hypothetical protein
MEAKQNLMAAAASAYRTALVPHAYKVLVRTPLHVGCCGGGRTNRVDLFAHALALRARADIDACAAGGAASSQGCSTDDVARSWLVRL